MTWLKVVRCPLFCRQITMDHCSFCVSITIYISLLGVLLLDFSLWLHPLEYHRPDGAVLHINGSTTDLRSCSASLELAEVDTIIEWWLCEMRQCLLSIVTSHVVEFSNFNYQLYLFLDYFMWLLFILIRHTMHSWQRRKQLHYQPGPLHVYADPCDLSM
jgi:hypothetical protein